MSDLFERKLATKIVAVEGGYVNDPRDSGGETNFGITVAVARQFGYQAPMREMTRAQAVAIYRARYWDGPGFDEASEISEKIAEELFDTGVNAGPKRAVEFLQIALNALNNQGKLYADILEDGDYGPGTERALKALLLARGKEGELVLLRALDCLQGAFYLDLARRRPKDEAFVYGWLRTRVGNVQ